MGLALDLCGAPAHLAAARSRFHASAPLRAYGLLDVEEPERPFLSRSLRVPDRLLAHLLGDDTPDAALHGLLHPLPRRCRTASASPACWRTGCARTRRSPPTCANTARATASPRSPRR